MSQKGKAFSTSKNSTTIWQEYAQRGMLDPTSQGPMLTDSPRTANKLPNSQSSQNWKNTSSVLQSNGVSVTLISPSAANKVKKDALSSLIGNGSLSIKLASGGDYSFSDNSTRINPATVKDGMAKCEYCGSVGVKQAFYTKKRNFCTARCVKASSKKTESGKPGKLMNHISGSTASDLMDYESDGSASSANEGVNTLRSSSSASTPYSESDVAVPNKKLKTDAPQTFEWTPLLNKPDFVAANVSWFKHAPVAHLWDNVTVGMKVEVENIDVDHVNYQTAFWVASVIKIQGYKVLLRFEGFGQDPSSDFWVNLCSEDVHHVGWCATKGKPLIPPRSIAAKFTDWRDFLVRRLTGARTLPQNFQSKVSVGLKSKYELGTELEVTDKNRICQLRLANVQQIVGKRLHVKYFNSDDDGGFWCHEDSPLIHPTGWSATIGHTIVAPKSYRPEQLPKSDFNTSYDNVPLKEGMKLEAIDPLNLSAICSATIKKVLKYGYIMVRVDCYEEDTSGSDWFCYHITSPYIFPCGFCAKHGIVLTPPLEYEKGSFRWDEYLQKTKSFRAPLLGLKDELEHDLKEGMKIEAADLMDPRLICVATISKVIGRLLKIHFDGWEEEYDQWLDATSPDIYPVGWAELVDHNLEAPRAPPPPLPSKKTKKGRKKAAPKQTKPIPKVNTKAAAKIAPIKVANKSPKVAEVSSSKSVQNNAENSRKILQVSAARKEAAKTNGSNNDGLHQRKIITTISPAKVESMGVLKTVSKSAVVAAECQSSNTVIPRLIDSQGIPAEKDDVNPELWTVQDVSEFLKVNECGAYCESFMRNKLDGTKLTTLTKDQIVVLTGMKVGPALKILDLINQLKKVVTAARARKSALSMK